MTKINKDASAIQPTRAARKRKAAATQPSRSPELAAASTSPPALKVPSKQDRLAALLLRDEGATLNHMVETTGWLRHTVRAALTGLKKKGYGLTSDKVDGVRTYRAVAPK